MKKLAVFPISLVLMLSLIGCAANRDTTHTQGSGTNSQSNTDNNGTGESAAGTNNTNNNNAENGRNESKVEVADDAADKIAAMNEVDSANVLVTDRNAYVGVVLKNGTTENEELKRKIADEVRSVRTDFNNVYVSFNPDVANRLTEYGNQIRSGEPVEGFFDEFTTGLNRMFPEAK
ncbi:YhcN/YlaJ family sporulation lipoprotein [Sporosarcina sp. ACRSL]|uniref:YhcN/YlaJ family sporulation lipoprotein n=1 Tax=Sporosarcina sp. ACRSL TaxID=2918215 RepID=UPI001EF6BC2D|nr:YhcN/YlaJ family sporulation lipoprotein [Sporosarcina sp. ACRSL]MCG7342967.1 YhcN/YlaJ family sporulation lipoprotein [Sporosarcina sp. ACRSL]